MQAGFEKLTNPLTLNICKENNLIAWQKERKKQTTLFRKKE